MKPYLIAALLLPLAAVADDGTPPSAQVALNINADMRKVLTVDANTIHISPTIKTPGDEYFEVHVISGTVLIIVH